jgi:hypothetical protein
MGADKLLMRADGFGMGARAQGEARSALGRGVEQIEQIVIEQILQSFTGLRRRSGGVYRAAKYPALLFGS